MFGPDSLRGIIPPLATPLTPGEDIDRAGMARLVEHVVFDTLPAWAPALKAGLYLMGICGPTAAAPMPKPTAAAPMPKPTAEQIKLIRAHLARSGLLA